MAWQEVVIVRHDTRIVADTLLDAAACQQFDLVMVPASHALFALLPCSIRSSARR
jgi:putative intracellular protease/amidase